MRKLHISNEEGRNTQVAYSALRPPTPPELGAKGEPVEFRRYLSATEECLHASLVSEHGEDYATALIEGDPEVAMEEIGRTIEETLTVFLTSENNVMHAPPRIEEVVYGPDGEEIKRGEALDVAANVNEELPVVWSKHRIKKSEAVHRFVFNRTLQIRHRDGLTFDYLFKMAKELDEEGEMVLVGSGAGGNQPLIFSDNSTPYRAFLEGRVKGESYQLLLHLSNLELRKPSEGD